MALTPFNQLASEDILSAHINGLSSAINNLESVLNLKTASVSNHTLKAVTDMEQFELRYRIYEGSIKNWTTFTVKRNGAIVSSSEYVAHAGFGAIVFNTQQEASSVITVDASYVINSSQTIEDMNKKINKSIAPVLQPKASWLNNFVGGSTTKAIDVTQANRAIDTFPIYINDQMTVDQMKSVTSASNTTSASMILGIYSNSDNYPETLLASTAIFDATTPGEYAKPLSNELVLEPGIYWLARYQTSGLKLDGFNTSSFMQILDPEDTGLINGSYSTINCVGVRSGDMGTLSALPDIFPALETGDVPGKARYFKRTTVGTVWIKRKS